MKYSKILRSFDSDSMRDSQDDINYLVLLKRSKESELHKAKLHLTDWFDRQLDRQMQIRDEAQRKIDSLKSNRESAPGDIQALIVEIESIDADLRSIQKLRHSKKYGKVKKLLEELNSLLEDENVKEEE